MMHKKFKKEIVLIEVYDRIEEYDLYNYSEHRTQRIHINLINWMTHSLSPFLHMICTFTNYHIIGQILFQSSYATYRL